MRLEVIAGKVPAARPAGTFGAAAEVVALAAPKVAPPPASIATTWK
jgi:hypothetical protein